MSSLNEKIQKVDPKTKYLVSGYMRNAESLFPQNVVFYNIPSFICHICAVFYWIPDPKQMELSLHSYRGCLDDEYVNSPKCLLFKVAERGGTGVEPYWSQRCSRFAPDEADWMVFEIDSKCRFLSLTKVIIQNYAAKCGVKELRVEIGNKDNNHWVVCDPPVISVSCGSDMQSFDVKSGYVEDAIHVRVTFLKNHGEENGRLAKFVVNYIEIHGIQLD